MKNGVFWDVTPCGSCKDRRTLLASVASYSKVVPSSLIIVTLIMNTRRFLRNVGSYKSHTA
jgi:hypothetical protein